MKTYYPKDAAEFLREIHTPRNYSFLVICPCCQRKAYVYWRKMNSGMCQILIRMARALHDGKKQPYDWLKLEEFFPTRYSQEHRDWTKMKQWTLVEPKDTRTATENAPGIWRITPTGHSFLNMTWTVASHGAFHDNVALRWSDKQVTIIEALGKKFNYYELMQGLLPAQPGGT